ncbi:MAG: hypothetical protein ACQESG_00400 [Nanobdellota archaeon]
MDFKKIGLLLSIVRPMSGPEKLYQLVPQYDKKFVRYTTFKIIHSGDCFVTFQLSFQEGYSLLKEDLDLISGMLSAIPTIWGFEFAEVTQIESHFDERWAILRCDWIEQQNL